MRALTPREEREFRDACSAIFAGVVASYKMEDEDVPEDMKVPPCELSPEDKYQLAVNLGIVRG